MHGWSHVPLHPSSAPPHWPSLSQSGTHSRRMECTAPHCSRTCTSASHCARVVARPATSIVRAVALALAVAVGDALTEEGMRSSTLLVNQRERVTLYNLSGHVYFKCILGRRRAFPRPTPASCDRQFCIVYSSIVLLLARADHAHVGSPARADHGGGAGSGRVPDYVKCEM